MIGEDINILLRCHPLQQWCSSCEVPEVRRQVYRGCTEMSTLKKI